MFVITKAKDCEDCHQEFIGSEFQPRCKYCERTYQLARIAEAIETWVGWQ